MSEGNYVFLSGCLYFFLYVKYSIAQFYLNYINTYHLVSFCFYES